MACDHERVEVTIYTMSEKVTEIRCLKCDSRIETSRKPANKFANTLFTRLRRNGVISCGNCPSPIMACYALKPYKIERWVNGATLHSATWYECARKNGIGKWAEYHECDFITEVKPDGVN